MVTHGVAADDDDALLVSIDEVSSASWSDDAPMDHVPLQFPFMYGGERYKHVWLSPNGFLSFAPVQPCGTSFADPGTCDFDSAPAQRNSILYAGYQSLVAVFCTDFDASASNTSVIRYASSASKLIVRWENMALYGSLDASFTFSAELRASGAIRIFLEEIKDISEVSDAPDWLEEEGLLVAVRLYGPQLNRTMITSAQKQARDDWLDGPGSSGTGVDGIYLPRASVIASNTRVDFCPVPALFCLSPGFLRLTALALSTGLNVTLTAAAGAWGCDDDLMYVRGRFRNFSVTVSSARCSVAVVDGAAPERVEVVNDGSSGGMSTDLVARTEVVCALPAVLLKGAGSYTVVLEWAPMANLSDWQDVPSSSDELVFTVLEAAVNNVSLVVSLPTFSPSTPTSTARPTSTPVGTPTLASTVVPCITDGDLAGATKISSSFGGLDTFVSLDENDNFGIAISGIGGKETNHTRTRSDPDLTYSLSLPFSFFADVDGDGVEDIAAGSSGDGDGGTSTGAVYVLFLSREGTVQEVQKLSSSFGGLSSFYTLSSGDDFGVSVSALGDLDQDGVVDVAVGARGDDGGGSSAGAIYLIFLNTDGTVKSSQKISQSYGGLSSFFTLADSDMFGMSIALLGDLDGDGVNGEIAV
jgi:hypothetical protein